MKFLIGEMFNLVSWSSYQMPSIDNYFSNLSIHVFFSKDPVTTLKLIRDTELCHGCCSCALACSYHFNRSFSEELGSIRVLTDYGNGEIEWSISTSCDSCNGEPEPLCVKCCLYGALGVVK